MVFAFEGLPSQSMAQQTCPMDMYQRADASLTSAASGWPSLLKHHNAFASCDDGALAESYSDAVVSLFADKWAQFGAFFTLAKSNDDFRHWAIRHIDATASVSQLSSVMRNAAECTDDPQMKNICNAIKDAAADALADSNQPTPD